MAEPQIPDSALRFIILGAFSAVVRYNPHFPVKVREVRENLDNSGQVESFTIITESGLRFLVQVDFDFYEENR